jgi:cytochrome P450
MASEKLEDGAAAQFDTSRMHKGGGACPASALGASFNPFTAPFLDEPYGWLKTARVEEPVFYSPEIDHWVVARYDDVRRVFQDHEAWSAANTLSAVTPMSPRVIARLRESNFRMNPVLTNLDPPEHVRIRKHATSAFSTRRVATAEPWIRALADDAIDRLLAKPADAEGRHGADMVAEFAYDLPAHVAFRFLGVPEDRVADVKSWTRNRVMLTWGRCDEERQWEEADGLIAMWRFCEDHVGATLEADADSFLGDLARFHLANPEELSRNEIESILFTMLVAGHETTTNAMANALLTLLEDRARWDELVGDPSKIANAVEEMLRYRPSIISWRRIAAQDVELGGQTIAKGSRVLLMIASANHDPEQFPEPETVDLCRDNARRHMAFGHGVHLCIGAGLARLELRVFLEQLIARMPGLTLEADQALNYLPNLSFRGPADLRVHW